MRLRPSSLASLLAIALLTGAAGCSGGTGAGVPETADAAINQIASGMADGEPRVLWQALPPSYQRDVTDLVHDFADRMDEDVWNRTFEVLGKVNRVLDEKRDFIMGHPILARQIDRAEADSGWNAVVEMMDVVFESELASLDELRGLDVGAFLEGTGVRFMEQVDRMSSLAPESGTGLGTLAERKASIIEADGDTARVRVRRRGHEDAQEIWVRVEGRWLAKSLADQWPQRIGEMREKLEVFSPNDTPESRAEMMMQLAMADGVLDTLLAADTPEEFNAGLSAVVGMAMGALMAQNTPAAMERPSSHRTSGAN